MNVYAMQLCLLCVQQILVCLWNIKNKILVLCETPLLFHINNLFCLYFHIKDANEKIFFSLKSYKITLNKFILVSRTIFFFFIGNNNNKNAKIYKK